MHKLSVVIPVLNEEHNLEKLFAALKAQKEVELDLILADAGSTDKSLDIAKKYRAKVVKGGLPAVGRNNGIKSAKYDNIAFLDADVSFSNTFLRDCMNYMKKRNIKVAGALTNPDSKKIIDTIYFSTWNFWVWFTQYFFPHAAGYCIFTKKKVHDKLQGFDENIRLGEDSNYVLRASKIVKFRIIPHKITTSVRRLDTEGRFKLAMKMFLCLLYRIIGKEDHKNLFNYNFNNHNKRKL